MPATVYPSGSLGTELEGAHVRERDVLLQLQRSLPNEFIVYHGIHWTRLEHGLTAIGRIQFLVLSPKGHVYCILMRTGLLRQDGQRLVKHIAQSEHDVFNLLAEQLNALHHKFKTQHTLELSLEGIFYCPDFTVPQATGLAVECSRIVDAKSRTELGQVILDLDAPRAPVHPPEVLHRFFCNALDLVPEVGALSEAANALITRLSQGLEHWVGRLHCEPFRLRVTGTAGSGKSQLALRELQRAHQLKLRVLYVCYNRPLSSHMAAQIRQAGYMGASVFNFHALCDRVLRDAGLEPDYSKPDAFSKLPEAVLGLPQDKRWVFDVILVDEGQDFDPQWHAVLENMSHPKTRWLWLEDPEQNLYGKSPVCLPNWVGLTVSVNYRNPRRIVQTLIQLRAQFGVDPNSSFDLEAACPLEGLPIEWMTYSTEQSMLEATGKAITQCLKKGFARDNIALLTLSGHERSRILKQNRVGPHTLKHFTGHYSDTGEQLFTQGSVLAESVYRFKGQSAHAVIITELAFQEFSPHDFRKLFVAMTRATVALVIVGDEHTVKHLQGAL